MGAKLREKGSALNSMQDSCNIMQLYKENGALGVCLVQ
jgi:hypothetical protein